MPNFSYEEINLMCMPNIGTKEGIAAELEDMRIFIDDKSMLQLIDSVLEKLEDITTAELAALDLIPDFGDINMGM